MSGAYSGAYREAHGYKMWKESLLHLPAPYRATNTSNKSSKSLSTVHLLNYWAGMHFLFSFPSNSDLRFRQATAL